MLQGIENQYRACNGPKKIQPAVSADVIVTITQGLLSDWDSHSESTRNSCVLVVFGFLFASRASTILSTKIGDMEVTSEHLIFHEFKQKSRSIRNSRRLQVPLQSCILADVIARFVQFKKSKYPPSAPLFGVSIKNDAHCGGIVTRQLKAALQLFQLHNEDTLSSHALRRGAAVSMNSLNVSIERVLSWGAWASQASLRPYVADRAWNLATEADKLCFGWMIASS